MPLTVLSGPITGTFEEAQDSAIVIGNPEVYNTPAPASLTGAANTLTAQQVINGIVTVNNAAVASTLTMPTAPALAAALRGLLSRGIQSSANGSTTLYCYVGNGGTAAVTLSVTGATGMSFDTNASQSLPANTSKMLIIRFTASTPGSETAVIFA